MRSTIPGTADAHESEMIFNKAAAAMVPTHRAWRPDPKRRSSSTRSAGC
jgi:hypothetical protein